MRQSETEQAALRRIATLVAQGAGPETVFRAVADEVAALLDCDRSAIARFETGGTATIMGGHSARRKLGERFPVVPGYVLAAVHETGQPARFDTDNPAAANMPEPVRIEGIRSGLAAPIVVDGELWGAMTVASLHRPFPPDTEQRLADFTDLIATAIANAESRQALARLADEQAALRRIATLVAQETSQAQVFAAIAREARQLLGTDALRIVRFDGESGIVVAGSGEPKVTPPGFRFPLDGDTVAGRISRQGRPARQDDYGTLSGPITKSVRAYGIRSVVGVPVLVEGRLWGVITTGMTREEPLPDDTESRLAQFTELMATAIANAEAHAEVERLAEEQAALRRVAVLVAQQPSPSEVFTAVTQAVGLVLGADLAGLNVFEGDATTTIAGWSGDGGPIPPIGSRFPLDGDSVVARIFETHAPSRIDSYAEAEGEAADVARSLRLRSTVGAPILVEGKLWGALVAGTRGVDPWAENAETRIAAFTDLVATAIANAESREARAVLTEEQAALRRVATLVAQGTSPQDLFDAVAEEIGRLLLAANVSMGRYEPDESVTSMASWSSAGPAFPPGVRWQIKGTNVAWTVLQTGRPARIDDFSAATDPIGVAVREAGYKSAVGSPIVVEGNLWGVISAASSEGPMPPDTEARLASFTELVATAIANAESQSALERLADEQAALRRVATLVARDAPSTEVFEAVATEVGKLLGTDITVVGRYDDDRVATAIGSWSSSPGGVPVGTRSAIGGHNVLTIVAETGKPARVDEYDDASGEAAEIARRHGWRSSIAAPIVVEGRVWGVMLVATQRPEPFPAGAEVRLAAFTDLVATAVANAQAHDQLRRFGEEQATLRRIATLVAKGVQPEEVFAAVTEEVAATFRAITAVMRFEHDPPGLVPVGVSNEINEIDIPTGARWDIDDALAAAQVYRTGRPARVGRADWSSAGAAMSEVGRRLGIVSTVACPISVEGRLWGVIGVNAREELPPDTEQRLEKFIDLVTTAIANAEGKSELAASRRRIVAASDETRRRIERDLHDGTQQRLVSLGLAVRAAEANLPPERDDLRAKLSGVARGLVAAVEDLQEISRGIHPAILSKGGLGPALQALAHRSPIPVNLDITTEVRLAEPIEVAAYFVASEALANAAKYSQASRIDVSLGESDGSLVLAVRDDGAGGADAARGSGIVGLDDRVEALGGSLRVDSRPGKGTQIVARLPLDLKLEQTV